MKLIGNDDDQIDVRLGLDELILLRKMLDEICNGFEFGEQEFFNVFDVQRHEAEGLLRRIDVILDRLGVTLDLE